MKKRLINSGWLFWALLIPYCSFAQNPRQKEVNLDEFMIDLFAVQDGDNNYDDLYESLFQFYRQPLNLNTATPDELRSLFILSEYQVNSLLKYQKTYGKLLTIWELQAVDGFDRTTFEKVLPFITVLDEGNHANNQPLLQRILQEDNQFVFLRYGQVLERQRGYSSDYSGSPYLGSPARLYARYRSSHTGDFSVGMTLEKDPGEQLTWDPATKRYGPDFISAHAAFYNKGKFKTIALGDYSLQFGQGLLLSGGFQVGKGAQTTATVKRNTRGILPYSSALEYQFFRGAATTYRHKSFDFTVFYSNRSRDSLNTETGFHRTENELARKGLSREQAVGGNVNYTSVNGRLKVGITGVNTQYSLPIGPEPNNYNQFSFRGTQNTALGTDFSYNWQNFSFFGEVGRSDSGGTGAIGGFVSSLSRTTELAVSVRHYDRHFHSLHGLAFGESTLNQNESGIYIGLSVNPSKRWTFATYYDTFTFPWLRFQANAPSGGYEWLGRLTFRPTRKLSIYGQFRYENRSRNLTESESSIDFLVPTVRQNYLLNLDFKANDIISLKSRFQGSSYQQEGNRSTGFVLLQDISFNIGYNLDISTRFALFDTDNFNNAQYVFEKNVLYAFSIPAYSGRGFRNYYLIRYKFSRQFDLWFRYAYTSFRDREIIGSGLDQINGNRRSEITVQTRYKF